MTPALLVPLARPGSGPWVKRVRAAVRAPFAADVLVVDASDPTASSGPCRVTGCDRLARAHGMCAGHHSRWAKAGRPDVAVFAATTDPGWARQAPNMRCRVPGCGYGCARAGLCQLHAQRWERSGRPDLADWLASGQPPVKAPVAPACQVLGCRLWPQASGPLCHAHHSTWCANGRPVPAVFAERFAAVRVPADQVIDLTRLAEPLRWEVAYALQCRHDQRTSRTPPEVVARAMRFLAEAGVTSLVGGDEQSWRAVFAASGGTDGNARAFVVYAHRCAADLAAGTGWDAEYPHDVWRLRRLGHPGNLTLDFTSIDQPWLRELAKRWSRQRMSTGVGLEAVRRGLTAITRLAGHLSAVGVAGAGDLTRGVIEGYLADLAVDIPSPGHRQVHLGQLRGFLDAVRARGWAQLHPTAAIFTDDNPPRPERGPRAVSEQVMAQLETPAAMAAWPDPAHRLITLILIRCGLRVGDATRLAGDCLVTDAQGAAYLRYVNHKMNREALVPLDDELHALITAQQAAPPIAPPRPWCCSRAPPATPTKPSRSAPPPTAPPCTDGSNPSTYETNTATACT